MCPEVTLFRNLNELAGSSTSQDSCFSCAEVIWIHCGDTICITVMRTYAGPGQMAVTLRLGGSASHARGSHMAVWLYRHAGAW